MRRAVAFIEEHLHQAIGLEDIAVAACVSTRSVHAAFQRHLRRTPLALLRRRRLDAVRTDLLAAGPGTRSVADVARRWGFRHGRFSAEYRDQHGELPRDTLRR